MTIRVIIADDQALLRSSLAVLVDTEDDMTVVAETADGAATVDSVRRLRPHVVLMDIRMPVMDGIEATRRIATAAPTSRVLILTTFDTDDHVYASLRAGASGFLLKDSTPRDLLRAIRVVAAGESLLAPSVTRRLIGRVTERRGPATRTLPGVTQREREVLELVGQGLSNLDISTRLHVSMATVKTHIGHLLRKLEARDRAQLVIWAYESGLVEVGGDRRSSDAFSA
ncbi:response regulator [Stackebrandtia soli]|uniref:response regulator n=1 Tax=Stackebrandtia soli TaxID=1892856 RepID=UPI0039ED5CEA